MSRHPRYGVLRRSCRGLRPQTQPLWIRMTLCGALVAATATLTIAPARADDSASARPPHWFAGAGGFVGITGPARFGPALQAIVYPGGSAGRFGIGVQYRGFEGVTSGALTAGIAYEAGASRPELVLELHGDIGITYGPLGPVAGAGLRLQLGLGGPVVVVADVAGHLVIDGVDTQLAIAPTLTVGMAL